MQQHFIRRIHRRPACQRVRRNHRQEQQQQLYISTLHQQQQQQPFDSSVTILFATNKWQEKRDDHGAWEMTNHQQQQPAPPPHYCHYHPLVCRQFNLQLGKQQMVCAPNTYMAHFWPMIGCLAELFAKYCYLMCIAAFVGHRPHLLFLVGRRVPVPTNGTGQPCAAAEQQHMMRARACMCAAVLNPYSKMYMQICAEQFPISKSNFPKKTCSLISSPHSLVHRLRFIRIEIFRK